MLPEAGSRSPELIAAHESYKQELFQALDPLGFTAAVRDEIAKKGCCPTLETRAEYPTSPTVILPPILNKIVTDIYPTNPVYVSELRLSEDGAEMVVRLTSDPDGRLIIPQQDGNPTTEILKLVVFDFNKGEITYHQCELDSAVNREGYLTVEVGRKELSPPMVASFATVAAIIKNDPDLYKYAASHPIGTISEPPEIIIPEIPE